MTFFACTCLGRYDGHAGTPCADYLTRHLHKNVLLAYAKNPASVEYASQAEGVGAALEQQLSCRAELSEVLAQVKQLREIEKEDDGTSAAALVEAKAQLVELMTTTEAAVTESNTEATAARQLNIPFEKALGEAMVRGFNLTDHSFLAGARAKGDRSGSTAVGALIHGTAPDDVRILVANTGDSRAVLCRSGRAVAMSEDHKPNLPAEQRRINRSGGKVIDANGTFRVGRRAATGSQTWLAVARAFGDIGLKEPDQCVIPTPDVETRHILPGDTFLLLACDGIFDVLSNQQAIDIAGEHLPGNPREAAAAVVSSQTLVGMRVCAIVSGIGVRICGSKGLCMCACLVTHTLFYFWCVCVRT